MAQRPVLIVEDDYDCRTMLSTLLSLDGFATVSAADGRQALEVARRERPCLILLDLMMPVMDGLEFRAQQQVDERIADIPVVLLSAHPNAAVIGRNLDAIDVIPKPIQPDRVLDIVDRTTGCASRH